MVAAFWIVSVEFPVGVLDTVGHLRRGLPQQGHLTRGSGFQIATDSGATVWGLSIIHRLGVGDDEVAAQCGRPEMAISRRYTLGLELFSFVSFAAVYIRIGVEAHVAAKVTVGILQTQVILAKGLDHGARRNGTTPGLVVIGLELTSHQS